MLIKNMHRNESLSDYMQKLFIADPPQNEMYIFFLLQLFLKYEIRFIFQNGQWGMSFFYTTVHVIIIFLTWFNIKCKYQVKNVIYSIIVSLYLQYFLQF